MKFLKTSTPGSIFDPINGSDISKEIILSRDPVEDHEKATKRYLEDAYNKAALEADPSGGEPVGEPTIKGPTLYTSEDNTELELKSLTSGAGSDEFIYAEANEFGRVTAVKRDLKGSDVEGGLDIFIPSRDSIDPKSPTTNDGDFIAHIQEELTSENLGIIDGYPLVNRDNSKDIKLDRSIRYDESWLSKRDSYFSDLEVVAPEVSKRLTGVYDTRLPITEETHPVEVRGLVDVPVFMSDQAITIGERVKHFGLAPGPLFGKHSVFQWGLYGFDAYQPDYKPLLARTYSNEFVPNSSNLGVNESISADKMLRVLGWSEEEITKGNRFTNFYQNWLENNNIDLRMTVSYFSTYHTKGDATQCYGNILDDEYTGVMIKNTDFIDTDPYNIWGWGLGRDADRLRRGTLTTHWVPSTKPNESYFTVKITINSSKKDEFPLSDRFTTVSESFSEGFDTSAGKLVPMIYRLTEDGATPEDFHGELTSPNGNVYYGIVGGEELMFDRNSTTKKPHIFNHRITPTHIELDIKVPGLERENFTNGKPEYWAFFFKVDDIVYRQTVMLNPRWYDGGVSLLPPRVYCSEMFGTGENPPMEVLGNDDEYPVSVIFKKDIAGNSEPRGTVQQYVFPEDKPTIMRVTLGYVSNRSEEPHLTERGTYLFGEYEVWFMDELNKVIDLSLDDPKFDLTHAFGGTQYNLEFDITSLRDTSFRVCVNNISLAGLVSIDKQGFVTHELDKKYYAPESLSDSAWVDEMLKPEYANVLTRLLVGTWSTDSSKSSVSGRDWFSYYPITVRPNYSTGSLMIEDSSGNPAPCRFGGVFTDNVVKKLGLLAERLTAGAVRPFYPYETFQTTLDKGAEGYREVSLPSNSVTEVQTYEEGLYLLNHWEYAVAPIFNLVVPSLCVATPVKLKEESRGIYGNVILPLNYQDIREGKILIGTSYRYQGRTYEGLIHNEWEPTTIPEGLEISGDVLSYAIEKPLEWGKQKDKDGNWINVGEVPYTGRVYETALFMGLSQLIQFNLLHDQFYIADTKIVNHPDERRTLTYKGYPIWFSDELGRPSAYTVDYTGYILFQDKCSSHGLILRLGQHYLNFSMRYYPTSFLRLPDDYIGTVETRRGRVYESTLDGVSSSSIPLEVGVRDAVHTYGRFTLRITIDPTTKKVKVASNLSGNYYGANREGTLYRSGDVVEFYSYRKVSDVEDTIVTELPYSLRDVQRVQRNTMNYRNTQMRSKFKHLKHAKGGFIHQPEGEGWRRHYNTHVNTGTNQYDHIVTVSLKTTETEPGLLTGLEYSSKLGGGSHISPSVVLMDTSIPYSNTSYIPSNMTKLHEKLYKRWSRSPNSNACWNVDGRMSFTKNFRFNNIDAVNCGAILYHLSFMDNPIYSRNVEVRSQDEIPFTIGEFFGTPEAGRFHNDIRTGELSLNSGVNIWAWSIHRSGRTGDSGWFPLSGSLSFPLAKSVGKYH